MSEAQRLVAEGDARFVDEDLEDALRLYSEAIRVEPGCAAALSKRAEVHLSQENYTDAIADANKAIEADPLLAVSFLRKGKACFALEEYETALAAFKAGASLAATASKFGTWIRKCEVELGGAMPDGGHSASEATPEQQAQAQPSAPALPHTALPAPSPPRYRHEWYQSASHVVVTVFAKGIASEQLRVDIEKQVLSVRIEAGGNEEPYILFLRLFGKVEPERSRHVLMSTKVEIKLTKGEPIHWTGLEASARTAVPQPVNVSDESARDLKNVYPSSGKQHVDWNKLEEEVKAEEKDEKLEGDAALNKLFQQIYRDADEDTRRAMNKSFVESSGTVLSTNWKEVGVKTVEPKS